MTASPEVRAPLIAEPGRRATCLLREFQVLYARPAGGPILSVPVQAESGESAAALVAAGSDVEVVSVGPGRDVLDESRSWFNTAEACSYLRCKETKLAELVGSGAINRYDRGATAMYRRQELDEFLMENLPD